MNSNLIWIDANVDNEENTEYTKLLESINSLKLRIFKNVDDAINLMENICYEETKVMVSGRLYPEFVAKFKENIIYMRISPKIIVFTGDKSKFLGYNPDYQKPDNKFYSYGGVYDDFDEIKQCLEGGLTSKISINQMEFIPKEFNKSYNNQLIFEYIDSKDKLTLPIFFKSLLDQTSITNMEEYTGFLYDTYGKDNNGVKNLLDQIYSIPNIPIEILAKYYARFYTYESNFYKDISNDLRSNNRDKYLPYIKVLYEGVNSKSLHLVNEKVLYRGSKLSNIEIKKLKDHLMTKSELPCAMILSKTFLGFTKDKNVALKFLNRSYDNNVFSLVLFILEIDGNIGIDPSTHCDLEHESYFPKEKPVLFFPFSCFEIKEIKENNLGKGLVYEIRLLYLGKYLKESENDTNRFSDSEFLKQLSEYGFINK